jgi:hypothetical protein
MASIDRRMSTWPMRGMIQLAWRFLDFQKESALAKWFRARTENNRGSRKKMIVALARKLLIALWHFVRDGVVPEGSSSVPRTKRGGGRSLNVTPDGFGPVSMLVTGRR